MWCCDVFPVLLTSGHVKLTPSYVSFLWTKNTCKASIKQAPTMDHAGNRLTQCPCARNMQPWRLNHGKPTKCRKHAAMKAQPWQTNKVHETCSHEGSTMANQQSARNMQPWRLNHGKPTDMQPSWLNLLQAYSNPDPTYANSHQAFRLNLYKLSSIILSIWKKNL